MTVLYAKDKNLFLVIGKYARRQSENLLTQNLAALFNHAEYFRKDFVSYVAARSARVEKSDGSGFLARTQCGKRLANCRIIVDLEILESHPKLGMPTPRTVFVVEAKLSAQLGPRQLKNYADYLREQGRNSQLVLLTRWGVDEALSQHIPKDTVWLTWTEIGELCASRRNTSAVEQFIRKEFIAMLEENDISLVPSVSVSGWKKISLFNDFGTSKSSKHLHYDAFKVVNNLITRMRIHADYSWSSLASEGYKPYAHAYVTRDKDVPYTTIAVGFFCPGAKKVYDRYVALELNCATQKLSVYGGWDIKKGHADYDFDWEMVLHEWTPKATLNLFNQPIYKALAKNRSILNRGLKKFKRTKYFYV